MAVKSLQVLYLGSSPIEKGHLVYGIDGKEIVNSAFLAFLIRTDDANILVDTGLHPDDVKELAARGFKIDIQPEDYLPQRLKEAGLSMDDIDKVLITHYGFDHNGWLPYLQHAEFIIQREEYLFGLEHPTYYRFFHPERYKSPDIKWKLVEGDQILTPGLTVLFTPGHTPGHQSVMVDLPKFGTIILSGDAGHFQENFEKELIPNVCCDQRQAWYSMKKLKVWSQVRNAPIFTSHDFDFWRREIKKLPEAYT